MERSPSAGFGRAVVSKGGDRHLHEGESFHWTLRCSAGSWTPGSRSWLGRAPTKNSLAPRGSTIQTEAGLPQKKTMGRGPEGLALPHTAGAKLLYAVNPSAGAWGRGSNGKERLGGAYGRSGGMLPDQIGGSRCGIFPWGFGGPHARRLGPAGLERRAPTTSLAPDLDRRGAGLV